MDGMTTIIPANLWRKLASQASAAIKWLPGRRFVAGILGGTVVILGAGSATAQTVSEYQATGQPLGLEVIDQVMLAGSDESSAIFQEQYLPALTELMNDNLGENVAITDTTAISLDPGQLTLGTDSNVRVYFVGEGAGYRNTLGFNVLAPGENPSGGLTEDSALIFPDASSSVSTYDPASTAQRTSSAPLLPGDFVELGVIESGMTLDFFLVSNGYNGWDTAYTADPERNPDGLNHTVAFALDDSPFLLIGFEDIYGGGDMDYNDLMFAVEIGEANVQSLIALSTPEPETLVLILILGIATLVLVRDQRVLA